MPPVQSLHLPALRAWLGIGRCLTPAFPDFERFYSGDFPPGTPIEVCCVYQFRHVREDTTLTQDAAGGVT